MMTWLFRRFRRSYRGLRIALVAVILAAFAAAALLPVIVRSVSLTSRSLTAAASTRAEPTGGGSPSGSTDAADSDATVGRFLTLNTGDTVDLSPGPVSFNGYPALLVRDGQSLRYRAAEPGHTVLTIGKGRSRRDVYVFVTPVASRQVGRSDLDWYKTQYGTGPANCGPALVSMAILWARGQDIPVESIRGEIGWPYEDGATSFDDLLGALRRHRVQTSTPSISSPSGLVSVLDRGHIAMVLIRSGLIPKVQGDPSRNLVGRYYDDDEGHYVIVKGYSLDRRYFVVYDPYPVDWDTNALRYSDGATMIGKNRYYPAADLFAALKTRDVIEVSPET